METDTSTMGPAAVRAQVSPSPPDCFLLHSRNPRPRVVKPAIDACWWRGLANRRTRSGWLVRWCYRSSLIAGADFSLIRQLCRALKFWWPWTASAEGRGRWWQVHDLLLQINDNHPMCPTPARWNAQAPPRRDLLFRLWRHVCRWWLATGDDLRWAVLLLKVFSWHFCFSILCCLVTAM
jgi:hypothetical protein